MPGLVRTPNLMAGFLMGTSIKMVEFPPGNGTIMVVEWSKNGSLRLLYVGNTSTVSLQYPEESGAIRLPLS